jgi:predicted nucleic acid-binding Zn ribbon protein
LHLAKALTARKFKLAVTQTDMTTYVYETIPAKSGSKPRYFEIKQRMTEAPLTTHPDTGEPIRRVVSGGFGLMSSKPAKSPPKSSCGPGCGCH